MLARMGVMAGWSGAAIALLLGGCSGLSTLLNPDFVSSLGGGQQVAAFPGNAPEILLVVENHTNKNIQASVAYRTTEGGVKTFTDFIEPGEHTARALFCPIEEITLGDLSDLTVSGAHVLLGTGLPTDPFVEVEPFGVVMQETINYSCGDEITFSVQASSATLSGYQVFAFIRKG
jgi:hypothetical protein